MSYGKFTHAKKTLDLYEAGHFCAEARCSYENFREEKPTGHDQCAAEISFEDLGGFGLYVADGRKADYSKIEGKLRLLFVGDAEINFLIKTLRAMADHLEREHSAKVDPTLFNDPVAEGHARVHNLGRECRVLWAEKMAAKPGVRVVPESESGS